jgi:hypothetical protein
MMADARRRRRYLAIWGNLTANNLMAIARRAMGLTLRQNFPPSVPNCGHVICVRPTKLGFLPCSPRTSTC